ncbi:hypothetical protein GYMLUDRAFT_410263 [Collybiopsis luxurians FD-317 M1]|uniref:Uncharacterized protein n=1 Tax=Collybiopsis luxurians FD-317 M1 TaxID=944289 RepID=A0A0D0AL56_9AGAR|nr:hypothetical protein GYMLUDRAFT_410263 [Collybiopsis luxurians FD-317 M1]
MSDTIVKGNSDAPPLPRFQKRNPNSATDNPSKQNTPLTAMPHPHVLFFQTALISLVHLIHRFPHSSESTQPTSHLTFNLMPNHLLEPQIIIARIVLV